MTCTDHVTLSIIIIDLDKLCLPISTLVLLDGTILTIIIVTHFCIRSRCINLSQIIVITTTVHSEIV